MKTEDEVLIRKIYVGDKERTFIQYVPKEVRSSTAEIMFFVPNGMTASQALENSLLTKLASADNSMEKFIVTILEPINGQWNIDEAYGYKDGDVAYALKVYETTQKNRSYFCVHESKHYLLGIKEGGTIANMSAMWNPAVFSGLATIDALPVSAQYASEAEVALCTDFNGFTEENGYRGLKKSSIPLPTWFVSERYEPEMLRYWINAAGITDAAYQVNSNTWEWMRSKDTDIPLNRDRKAYRVRFSVSSEAADDLGNKWLLLFYKDFLFKHRRWMGDPGGDLRVCNDPVKDLGCEYHCEEIGGFLREWYVYVPSSVRERANDMVPLVIAMHGYSCSGEIYCGNSNWNEVADKYGFIVAFPSATPGYVFVPVDEHEKDLDIPVVEHPAWNFLGRPGKPDEFQFFSELIKRIKNEHRIDPSRIYLTGHSHGSMMTHALGMAMTETFAAIAPCSGTMFNVMDERSLLDLDAIKKRKDVILPCWMFVGEKEPWLIPAVPKNGNKTAEAIETWRSINHIEPARPESWAQDWETEGTWHTMTSVDSEHRPMVKQTWIEGMPHAVTPDMSFAIWEQFFSLFRREGNNVQFLGQIK